MLVQVILRVRVSFGWFFLTWTEGYPGSGAREHGRLGLSDGYRLTLKVKVTVCLVGFGFVLQRQTMTRETEDEAVLGGRMC